MELARQIARLGVMSMPSRSAVVAALVLILASCSGTAPTGSQPTSPPPVSIPPRSTPTSTPGGVGAIDHATGPTDVLLRYEEGGGFVMPAWTAASAPIFTLYGDGTITFRNLAQAPLPAIGSVAPFHPFRTARMNEEQVQALLAFALGAGGLGTARANYANDMIADASSATFTVNAGGLAKTVSVYALGIDAAQVPDGPARQAFVRLRDHLIDIDHGGSIKTDVYAPGHYRGILLDGQPGAADQKAWPWKEIKTSEFVGNGDPNALQLPSRVLTVADVERLGIQPFQGGFVGLPLAGPGDGTAYSLSLRPLMPEETK